MLGALIPSIDLPQSVNDAYRVSNNLQNASKWIKYIAAEALFSTQNICGNLLVVYHRRNEFIISAYESATKGLKIILECVLKHHEHIYKKSQ